MLRDYVFKTLSTFSIQTKMKMSLPLLNTAHCWKNKKKHHQWPRLSEVIPLDVFVVDGYIKCTNVLMPDEGQGWSDFVPTGHSTTLLFHFHLIVSCHTVLEYLRSEASSSSDILDILVHSVKVYSIYQLIWPFKHQKFCLLDRLLHFENLVQFSFTNE